MSKTIKLEDQVYTDLTGYLQPKETYSQCLARILGAFSRLGELRDVLEGVTKFRQGQARKIDEILT